MEEKRDWLRGEFEAWAYQQDYSLEGTCIKGRTYSSDNTHQAMLGWQAALREIERLKDHAVTLANTERIVERERCAKVCEDKLTGLMPAHPAHSRLTAAAAEIRCKP